MNFEEHIVINPAIRSGNPCVKGTRITVYDILEYFAGGMTEAEILEDFPVLSQKDIQMVFTFARKRRLEKTSPPASPKY